MAPTASPEPIVLSWSSGKDSAWALYQLQQAQQFDVVALITTLNDDADRVAMHGVRQELVTAQAREAGLPLVEVRIPQGATNEEYETVFGAGLDECATRFGTSRFAFGDLFLEDIREYRDHLLKRHGYSGLYPLWGQATDELAHQMLAGGLCARVTCIDRQHLPDSFAGREYDATLLAEFPESVDPCGENGEFHSFAWAGPMFTHDIPIRTGEQLVQDRFVFADLTPAAGARS